MPRYLLVAIVFLSLGSNACGAAMHSAGPPAAGPSVAWSEWSPEAFERAREENKPILLSVQAGWCHWCHVMNATTYRDADVVRRLHEEFVVIRADADARPDLVERYRQYGWPATVFLGPDGRQILGLRGHRNPARFRTILEEVARAHAEGRTLDDARGTNEAPADDLAALRVALTAQLDRLYDEDAGGWGRRQRYPFPGPVEHSFYRAAVHGDAPWRGRALFSAERYALLIDPVWGGMYQYSVPVVWDRPHFEKIVPVQAGAIRNFAEAYRVTGDPRWLEYAESVRAYLREFLRAPDGAFYVSQDADLGGHGQPGPHVPGNEYYALDDAGRRELGIPRVDTHVYAASNGLVVEALAQLAVAADQRAPLAEATRAMERILGTHRHATGLFVHDAESDDPVLYLNDQVHVLAALLALHQASSHRRWLDEARALADAMVEHLGGEGFFAHTEDPRAAGFFSERQVPILDNGTAARAFIQLARLLDVDSYREIALTALRATARPGELRALGRMIGPYLLALEALENGHIVLSVVGPEDPRTDALHLAALRFYEPTRLVELGRPGASRYPYPGEPAIFMCTSEACSMPVFDSSELATSVSSFLDR